MLSARCEQVLRLLPPGSRWTTRPRALSACASSCWLTILRAERRSTSCGSLLSEKLCAYLAPGKRHTCPDESLSNELYRLQREKGA
eukprot:4651296-Pleurochrysis_carterae.AAC.1